MLKPTATGGNTANVPTATATAAPGTLPVGSECKTSEECAGGARCYATNSMLITRCGNFQASCYSDSQCATNTCNMGFCNGPLPSGSSLSKSVTGTATAGGSNGTPTGGAPAYTGAASKANVGMAGLMGAMVFALAL
ncbi:hypothetical protein ABW20_dc0100867 [Dactylellina cionopaga]|nr:hypothetical protein ABW20_dc0100867 [Dactylellina cionopaga]